MVLGSEGCGLHAIHHGIVKKVAAMMPPEDKFCDLAEFFKILGVSTRLKILYALQKEEMCVCDIAALLGMTQSAISHQLRVLRGANFVKYRRAGKVMYYSLSDEHVGTIFNQGFEHISHG